MNSTVRAGDVVVDRLHALSVQRAGVLDGLLADTAEARILSRVVDIRRFAVQHATRPKVLPEHRLLWIVGILRLLLGVEVVQVAVELVEAVDGGQKQVAIAKVVLPELPGDVTEGLEQVGNRRVLRLQTDGGPRRAHLGQPGADRILAGDEGRPPGGAALLAVIIGEIDPFAGDAVDVGRLVAHHAPVVVADVEPADVITHQGQDVRFSVWHGFVSLSS